METSYLETVKTAMEASFVIGYDEQNVYNAVMDPDTGIITCTYLHPSDPDTTYFITIVGEKYLVAIVESGYNN